MSRLASWVPPIAWMGVIAWFSTATWSAEHTGDLLYRLTRWLAPSLTPADLVALHHLIRKLTHLTIYAILAALWWRALVREGAASPRGAVWIALAVTLGWAVLDEAHQATEPARTGSALDVAIDGAGAVAALALLRRGGRGAVEAATRCALWAAAVGGAAALAVNALAGVESGLLWITAPAAVLALVAVRFGRHAPTRLRPSGGDRACREGHRRTG